MGLNILGLANPLFLLFGQFATRRQEAEIAELNKRGITPPEVNENIFTKIVDGFTNILGIDKKQEIEQAIINSEKVASPVVSSVVNDPRLLPTGSLPTTPTPTTPYIPEDPNIPTTLESRKNVSALRDKIEEEKSFDTATREMALASARATRDAGFDLAAYGRGKRPRGESNCTLGIKFLMLLIQGTRSKRTNSTTNRRYDRTAKSTAKKRQE